MTNVQRVLAWVLISLAPPMIIVTTLEYVIQTAGNVLIFLFPIIQLVMIIICVLLILLVNQEFVLDFNLSIVPLQIRFIKSFYLLI